MIQEAPISNLTKLNLTYVNAIYITKYIEAI